MYFEMLDILMFNENGFLYLPVARPQFQMTAAGLNILGEAFDGSICTWLDSCEDGIGDTLPVNDIVKDLHGWKKCLKNQQYLRGFISKVGNFVSGEFYYLPGKTGYIDLLKIAFESFLQHVQISSLHELNRLILVAKNNRLKNYSTGERALWFEKDAIGVVPPEICNLYFSHNQSVSKQEFGNMMKAYARRIQSATIEYGSDKRVFSLYSKVLHHGQRFDGILFFRKYIEIEPVHTPLDKQVVIISGEDTIANILYKISLVIQPTILYLATGYVYDSGLSMLKMMKTLYSLFRFPWC